MAINNQIACLAHNRITFPYVFLQFNYSYREPPPAVASLPTRDSTHKSNLQGIDMHIVQLRNIRTSKLHSPFFFSLQKKLNIQQRIYCTRKGRKGQPMRRGGGGQTYNGREFLYVEFVFEVAWA